MIMKEYKVLQKSHINHLKDDSAIPWKLNEVYTVPSRVFTRLTQAWQVSPVEKFTSFVSYWYHTA